MIADIAAIIAAIAAIHAAFFALRAMRLSSDLSKRLSLDASQEISLTSSQPSHEADRRAFRDFGGQLAVQIDSSCLPVLVSLKPDGEIVELEPA